MKCVRVRAERDFTRGKVNMGCSSRRCRGHWCRSSCQSSWENWLSESILWER
ncbi:hypothetical protein BDV11DRAFT_189494 [Aspergillus similis]